MLSLVQILFSFSLWRRGEGDVWQSCWNLQKIKIWATDKTIPQHCVILEHNVTWNKTLFFMEAAKIGPDLRLSITWYSVLGKKASRNFITSTLWRHGKTSSSCSDAAIFASMKSGKNINIFELRVVMVWHIKKIWELIKKFYSITAFTFEVLI